MHGASQSLRGAQLVGEVSKSQAIPGMVDVPVGGHETESEEHQR